MKTVIAFLLLGFIFGALLNFNSFFSSLISNKIAGASIDIFMMACYAFIYFSFMLAYCNGSFFSRYLILTFLGFAVYFSTIYKPLNRLFNLVGGKLNSMVKTLLKKLNFGKKYCKKLLHYNGK